MKSAKQLTIAEIAHHDSCKDCWIVVRGKVYDVTSWVPRHPGGDIIFVNAGKDCTQLFESYHSLSARRVLEKFYVGDVEKGQSLGVEYADDTEDGKFYHVLKERVEKYMNANKMDPRWAPAMYIKTAIIIATLVLSYLGTFFYFKNTPACLLCAVLMGASMAEVGVSIQHDANHGAYHKNRTVNHYMGWLLDAVGASSFMWKQQHVVGHHAYTNLHDHDPDIRVSEVDVRRVTSYQPWFLHHRYQQYYLGVLYGLLSLKSVLLDDFTALSSGKIGPVSLTKLTKQETIEFWLGKSLFFCYFVGLPLVASNHSLTALLAFCLISQGVTGWMLAFMFQVAHVTEDVEYVKSDANGFVNRGWAEVQVATTADFSHGSFFWTHISGGLNYQVVHHLFPGICHVHYPKIAPIVMQTCKEFNIPYVVYPTFLKALMAHFKQLKHVGADQIVPSLATVG
eukprot:CAMPEP_0117674960 /NCGR_PEP_ID=MMETSP0804-20121206/15338_1 /TAXON_ID=1074897 /ORGANISM="Tetraselmis astigmatica, Strain CCMP880" /LENGTH=451 /DNA_ID=CAMNT_0005483907 /DNA_START=372 /DNA_END=1727 /DNA_ORIENTATION=-